MSFLEPLFLGGLLAAAVPLAIHLINRQKAVRQPFPPLELLRESDEKEARSLKVREWLLMLLRILAVALLALALAKPYVLSNETVGTTDRLPKSVVFVLDDTMSMQANGWWERAEERLRSELSTLNPWDEVALVTATDPNGPVDTLENDRQRVRRALSELEPSEQTASVPAALAGAADLLSTSELPNRRIVLVSDFTEGGFPEASESTDAIEYPVRKISVREGPPPDNVAVTRVDYRQVGSPKKAKWEFSATLENFGNDPVDDREIRLTLDGETVAAGLVSIDAGGSTNHVFRHTVEGEGIRRGTIELVGDSALAGDDRRYFTFRANPDVDVLLVNGAPSSVPYQDELFFTVRALRPDDSSDSKIVPRVITTGGFSGDDLSNYDVVLVANATGIPDSTVARLQKFVEEGGGLFFAVGDQIEPDAYNQKFGDLLPRRLRRVKLLAEKDDPDAPVKITHMGAAESDHPVFEVFNRPGGESLQSVRVYKYMLLEPSPLENSRVLLSYKDGAPALLERRVGDGHVMLLTTTLDRAWTDLPVRTSFLPLLRRSMFHLARRTAAPADASHRVGDRIEVQVGDRIEDRAAVRGPDDLRYVVAPREGRVSFRPERAGFYDVAEQGASSAKEAAVGGLVVPVNVGTEESRLDPLPDDAYDPWVSADDASEADGGEARSAKRRVNIWPALLFAVTIALLLETLVGTRRSVLRRVWRRLTFQSDPEVEV